MTADRDERSVRDAASESSDDIERMQARLDELGEHIEQASKQAQGTRELPGKGPEIPKKAASGEMQTPAGNEEATSGDADPGDPLGEVVDESDVTPSDGR